MTVIEGRVSRVKNILPISWLCGVFLGIASFASYNFFIDVHAEQKLLLDHDIIIWQHPFYWYSAPAIIKEWMDLVLEHGFAYGENGRSLEANG